MIRTLALVSGVAVSLAQGDSSNDEFQMPYSELWHSPSHSEMDNGFKCSESEVRNLMRYANENAKDSTSSECGGHMSGDSSDDSSFKFWDGSETGHCAKYVLSDLCHATTYNRDFPSQFIFDFPNVVLCCAQLGASPDDSFPDIPIEDTRGDYNKPNYQLYPARRDFLERIKLKGKLENSGRELNTDKTSPWAHPKWTGLAATKAKFANRQLAATDDTDSDGSDTPYDPADYDFSKDPARTNIDCNNYYAVRDVTLGVFDDAPRGTIAEEAFCYAGQCRVLGMYAIANPNMEPKYSYNLPRAGIEDFPLRNAEPDDIASVMNLCTSGVIWRDDFAWTLASLSQKGVMQCCKDDFDAHVDGSNMGPYSGNSRFWNWYDEIRYWS